LIKYFSLILKITTINKKEIVYGKIASTECHVLNIWQDSINYKVNTICPTQINFFFSINFSCKFHQRSEQV